MKKKYRIIKNRDFYDLQRKSFLYGWEYLDCDYILDTLLDKLNDIANKKCDEYGNIIIKEIEI